MKDFTKGSVTKHILVFTVPVLLGSIFGQLYSIADAIVIGRYISGEAIAAIASSIAIVNFINGSLLGLTTGASVVISQCYGAREEQKLYRTYTTSIIFLVFVSIIFSVIGFVLTPLFLRLLSTPIEVLDLAITYQRITICSMVLPALSNMYFSYMRALGNSKHPLFILISSSLLNIVLDYLFVAQFNFGVKGVALATIVSQIVAILLCLVCINLSVPILRITTFSFDKEVFPTILKYGIPAAIQMSVTSMLSLSITRLANSFGATAAAGYGAATRLDNFALTPLDSISTSLATFVGQNIGAGDEERAKKGYRSTRTLMISVAAAVSLIILLLGRQILQLFVNRSDTLAQDIIKYGWEYLSVIGLFYVLHAIFFSFNGFFRGAGDALVVMFLTISSLSIRAISSYLLSSTIIPGPGAIGWAIPIGWALCSFAAFIYYKKGIWRRIRIAPKS